MRKLIFHWLFFTFHFLWEENLLALCHVVGTDGHNLVTNIQTAGHNEVLTITFWGMTIIPFSAKFITTVPWMPE